MNPTLVTFGGLVVAVLIITWAVTELAQRYSRQKKAGTQAHNAWVIVRPTTTHSSEDVSSSPQDAGNEGALDTELYKRAKQNGHHSQSKKPL